jgi:hypothetical protein
VIGLIEFFQARHEIEGRKLKKGNEVLVVGTESSSRESVAHQLKFKQEILQKFLCSRRKSGSSSPNATESQNSSSEAKGRTKSNC